MIKNLKFDERDLKFFDRQLEDKSDIVTALHFSVFKKITFHNYVSGKTIAATLGIEPVLVRRYIADIRRYLKEDKTFITATNEGYTLSMINCCEKCNNNIITYFHKTQTRWKETFYELNNLMKILNRLKNEKTK